MKDINQQLDSIHAFIVEGWNNQDPSSLREYAKELVVFKALVNELKVVDEGIFIDKLEQFRKELAVNNLKQYEYRDIRDVYCKDSLLLKERVDRVSNSVTHALDALRGVMFHSGQEMKMLNYVENMMK